MAEKPEDQVSTEEKISKGKELFGRGCRNFYVKCYSDAADDLSEACKLYGEIYGVDGDELGEVYLLYAKALIALGQDENKLIEVPENEDEDEPVEEDDGSNLEDPVNGNGEETNEKDPVNGNATEDTANGTDNEEAGPSKTNDDNESEEQNENDEGVGEEDDGGNLEVAWEVLQNAALIFQRQEEKGLSNLLEVYNEMAGISIENGNFALALDDFGRALNTFDCIEESSKNYRIAAEIHYKLGLCQSMEKSYDEAIKSFQKAHDILSDVVEIEKSKGETEEIVANIKDMEETQQEIMNKITEIGDVKADEIEQVKRELTKLYGMIGASSSSSADQPCSSSSIKSPPVASDKPKATDISHLIKRKKPDVTDATIECSPVKKQIIETSEAVPLAVPVEAESKDKIVEEPMTVQPAVDN